MRLVLLLTAVGGVGLVVCELLGPVRFADLAGGARRRRRGVRHRRWPISFGAAAVGRDGGAGAAPAARAARPGSPARCSSALRRRARWRCSAGPDVLVLAGDRFRRSTTWPTARPGRCSAPSCTPASTPRTGRPRCRRCRWPWRSAGSSATSPSRRLAAAVSIEAAFARRRRRRPAGCGGLPAAAAHRPAPRPRSRRRRRAA